MMQEGNFTEINTLGKRLSLEIGCPVTWPGHNKNMFVCVHDITFPVYRLKGSVDWGWALSEHEAGIKGGE